MVMIITPSVVVLFDLDHDISIMVDTNEEEEKAGKESSINKDVKILQALKKDLNSLDSFLSANPRFYSNSYTSNYQELISPPPEHII